MKMTPIRDKEFRKRANARRYNNPYSEIEEGVEAEVEHWSDALLAGSRVPADNNPIYIYISELMDEDEEEDDERAPIGSSSCEFLYEADELEQLFQTLAEQWRKETGHLSSITQKCMHPAYQNIIGLGPQVLPLILRELEMKGGHWFWALTAITRIKEDPVPPEDAGVIKKMAEAWLKLAKERGWMESSDSKA